MGGGGEQSAWTVLDYLLTFLPGNLCTDSPLVHTEKSAIVKVILFRKANFPLLHILSVDQKGLPVSTLQPAKITIRNKNTILRLMRFNLILSWSTIWLFCHLIEIYIAFCLILFCLANLHMCVQYWYCAADFSLLNLPKGKSLGRSKPATNS